MNPSLLLLGLMKSGLCCQMIKCPLARYKQDATIHVKCHIKYLVLPHTCVLKGLIESTSSYNGVTNTLTSFEWNRHGKYNQSIINRMVCISPIGLFWYTMDIHFRVIYCMSTTEQ